ncbi:unnamed protein product [Arctia plantaginis]|uniref:Uncharacterized protein n=1 Tax=Arctia plantaginis TaxID=874455 RepID=A0A8S0ZYV8_ARCPL|nr:unnamed protein product [Arctia plantaginis]
MDYTVRNQCQTKQFADFQQPEFDEFDFIHDNIKKPDFKIPKFDSFTFKPLDMERIKSYVPESNEKFKGSGYTYNSYSSNLNGVKKGGATFATVNNDNGKVVEKQIDLHNGPH